MGEQLQCIYSHISFLFVVALFPFFENGRFTIFIFDSYVNAFFGVNKHHKQLLPIWHKPALMLIYLTVSTLGQYTQSHSFAAS